MDEPNPFETPKHAEPSGKGAGQWLNFRRAWFAVLMLATVFMVFRSLGFMNALVVLVILAYVFKRLHF